MIGNCSACVDGSNGNGQCSETITIGDKVIRVFGGDCFRSIQPKDERTCGTCGRTWSSREYPCGNCDDDNGFIHWTPRPAPVADNHVAVADSPCEKCDTVPCTCNEPVTDCHGLDERVERARSYSEGAHGKAKGIIRGLLAVVGEMQAKILRQSAELSRINTQVFWMKGEKEKSDNDRKGMQRERDAARKLSSEFEADRDLWIKRREEMRQERDDARRANGELALLHGDLVGENIKLKAERDALGETIDAIKRDRRSK